MGNSQEEKIAALLNIKPVNKLTQQAIQVRKEDGYFQFEPAFRDVNLKEWVRSNQATVDQCLRESGAILFRGFGLNDLESFRAFVDTLGIDTLEYSNRSSPRTELKDKIYTSTDHPSDQRIYMHNELSYSTSWPLKIMFFCNIPASEGGETPIADGRKVLSQISQQTQRRFRQEGIMYVRNLRRGIGMSWEQVFQSDDREKVEAYCRDNNNEFEWKDDGSLILRWRRPAILEHPLTLEEIWFNHGLFFNSYTLGEEKLAVLRDSLPFETFYGSGEAITHTALKEIDEAYDKSIVMFPWQKGDLLLLDNMLVAHGRQPFKGKREILVAMAEAYHL